MNSRVELKVGTKGSSFPEALIRLRVGFRDLDKNCRCRLCVSWCSFVGLFG